MRYLSSRRSRDLDRLAGQQSAIPGADLMERAGAGAAAAALRLASGLPPPVSFTVVAGCGNNGGDGLVAARWLRRHGALVTVLFAGSPKRPRGEARQALDRALAEGVCCQFLPEPADWTAGEMSLPISGVCVDALLGTGAGGLPRGAVAAAIEWLRRLNGGARVLALDLPSGIDADSGEVPASAVRADMTLAFGYPKPAMRRQELREWFGRIEVLDIGLPPLPPGWAEEDLGEMIAAPDWAGAPPRRPVSSHKGNFGHVLVAGGSPGFAGAPLLSARAALRAGAGMVSLVVPDKDMAAAAVCSAPEIMARGLSANGRQGWSQAAWAGCPFASREFDAVVAGPGMGTCGTVRERIADLAAIGRGLVLDADGLNVWSGRAPELKQWGKKLVITPHPAEAARLLGCSTGHVQGDRELAVRRLAAETGAVVVLKGASTLVAAPGSAIHLNVCGNPGMATAGAGDVLGGIIGALIGQGMDPFPAACLGVYLHGTAGDLAAWKTGQAALVAGDLISFLGQAWLTIQPR